MRVADVMQKGVLSVSPELSVSELEEFLTSEDISGAPVLNPNGELVGIASKTDVVRALSDRPERLRELLDPDLTVEDIMTRDITTVTPETDVKEVAAIMTEGHVHRVLIADEDGLIGIVTSLDLLKLLT